MDFIQALDPSKLVLAETALSFLLSPFTAPPYNLAIFLFGIYAAENSEAVLALQTFTGLVGVSAIFDFVWMLRNEQNGFIKTISVLIMLIKVPTFFAFGNALRERRVQFGVGGLNIRGGDINGPTVWSMPGGFTSGGRDGYQTVDEEAPAPPTAPKPTSLSNPLAAHHVPQTHDAQPAPGGYQNAQ